MNNLLIDQSKSRARHTNDNALVESKNGSIVHKLFGRNFIAKKYAPLINQFDEKYINLYLNYHRPCLFSEDKIDKLGKVRKNYKIVLTPYEKLKSLEKANEHLKAGVTFSDLDKIALVESDNSFGKKMLDAKDKLFKKISHKLTN